MGVEQEDMSVRIALQDPLQNQRKRTRLARACGPEDGEMFRQHLIHADIRANLRILVEVADADDMPARAFIDDLDIPMIRK